MKKVFVGITALLVATGVALASDCTSGGKKCGCKPKKYRVIYVTAHNPETMYDNSMFEAQEVGPEYRMVPTERSAAMHDRRASFEEDDKYYDNYSEAYDDEFYETEYAPRGKKSTGLEGGYIGGRVGVDLLSWENNYRAMPATPAYDTAFAHDRYLLKPLLGGDIFVGLHLNPAVRLDVELGYISQFSDSDSGFTFKLSAPYATLNAYYDFINGVYLGLGAGMAFPKASMDWDYFTTGKSAETTTSFMGAVMLGYSTYLSDHVVLDLRYRLSGFQGPKWTRGVDPAFDGVLTSLEMKTGYIIDNALTIGLRYEF